MVRLAQIGGDPAEVDGTARRPRHAALLVSIVLAHGALIAMVIAAHMGLKHETTGRSQLVTFDVMSPNPPAPKPAAAATSTRDIAIVTATIAPVAETASPIPVADGAIPSEGGCDLTEAVQATLRASARARSAIDSLPRTARSVANAVMLWDGGWVMAGGAQAQGALGIIRSEVAEVVARATPECRGQTQAGPRLLVMPGAPDVTLAIGSGRWRWGDLDPAPNGRHDVMMASASAEPILPVNFNFASPRAAASGAGVHP